MIIAHRGNSSYAPENTLASVQSAWDVQADAVEVDIHLTADEQVVVIHDPDTERTSGEKRVVADSTYGALSGLDVGSHKGWHFRNERIPRLADIVATIPAEKTLFIEIKCDRAVIPHLKRIIDGRARQAQVAVICFNLDVLAEAKQVMPTVPMYWLVRAPEDPHSGQRMPYDPQLIVTARDNGLDGLDLHDAMLSRDYVQQIHAAGMAAYVWTVDSVATAACMRNVGVDGMTTNYPAEMKRIFKP